MHEFTFWIFLLAILKCALVTGIGPGLLLLAAIHIGRTYRVLGVFPGEFIGRCIAIMSIGGKRFIQILITDALRSPARAPNKCPFPQCIYEADHGGEHGFPRIREGNWIDVPEQEARFIEVQGKEVA